MAPEGAGAMNNFVTSNDGTGKRFRATVLGALLLLAATTFGGCFLFPRASGSLPSGSRSGTGRIDGRIVDAHGQGLAGVSVTIPEAGELTAVTGADGRFTLAGLAGGEYYVLARKEGYLDGAYAVEVSPAAAAVLTGQALLTSSHLHNDSARVPGLCGECHVLHSPTGSNAALKGPNPSSACMTCHAPALSESVYLASPHGSQWRPDLNTPVATVWSGQDPALRGNCGTCHEPHGITGPPFMLRKGAKDGDGTLRLNALCLECHAAVGSGHTAGWPGKASYTDPANLHYAASSVPSTTKVAYPGTTYAQGECNNCHVPHGQAFSGVNDPRMTRDQGYKLCVKCHTDKAASVTSSAGHGNCLMCHDPHSISKSGAALKVKDPLNPTGPQIVPAKETYRGESMLSNSYCQKCHTATPPSWLSPAPRNPLADSTKFWNQSKWVAYGNRYNDQNLHNVHLNRIWSSSPYHNGITGDLDKIRCNQCHSVHPTIVGRNFVSSRLSAFTGTYSGNWQTKNGCTVGSGCHTCNWCHASPGAPATACWSCSYHSYYPHSAVAY